jgi:hypothetical protein
LPSPVPLPTSSFSSFSPSSTYSTNSFWSSSSFSLPPPFMHKILWPVLSLNNKVLCL